MHKLCPVPTRFLLLCSILVVGACDCGDEGVEGLMDASLGGDGGPGNGDGSVPPDSGFNNLTDSGPGSLCTPEGQACDSANQNCCSGVCGDDGTCATAIFCAGPDESCNSSADCCSLACINGTCSPQLCQSIGSACTGGSDCCSGICAGDGTCAAVPPGPGGETCTTLGEVCNDALDCCSTNCQGGICVRAYYCQADGDICFNDGECCGNRCSATASATTTVGRCEVISGGGAGGCIQGGNPCPNGGSNCCSRVCVDVGTGAAVCQVAGGCRLTGQWCPDNNSCCGGGVNPNGTVMCNDAPIGRCDNGQACNPVGNICGAPVLANGGSINASQNCCNGKKEVCKLDSSGIPRCFGGCPANGDCDPDGPCPTGYDGTDPNCCIPEGAECQFRDQCCGLRACVPMEGGDGIFVCAEAPNCVPLGDQCVPGEVPGCCPGTSCQMAAGGGFACQQGDVPLDGGVAAGDGGVVPGTDGGGVADAGDVGPIDAAPPPDSGPPCVTNGDSCSSGTECCSGICGEGGICVAPTACQPEASVCSASADCCQGLECIIMPGNTTGSCQSGASCSNVGQACSAAQACCSGLRCAQTGSLVDCDGTTACNCVVDL